MYSLITAGIFFQISLPLSDNSFLLNIICLKGIAQSHWVEALLTRPLMFDFNTDELTQVGWSRFMQELNKLNKQTWLFFLFCFLLQCSFCWTSQKDCEKAAAYLKLDCEVIN